MESLRATLDALLGARRHDEAVISFLAFVGMPVEALTKLKASPARAGMVAMAPTLVMDGGASAGPMPFMRATADELGMAIPGARRLVIDGQGHDVSPTVLAPILIEFFDAKQPVGDG